MKYTREQISDIRSLNDSFRSSFNPLLGQVVMTRGVVELPDELRDEVVTRVASFNDFTSDNDPHLEHDFGSFSIEPEGVTINWKIDYFARHSHFNVGAEYPWDEQLTERVLTIMRSEEY